MIRPDAPTEADSERDGLLSYSKEWHALTVCLAVGVVVAVTSSWDLAVLVVAIVLGARAAPGPLAQLRQEAWYALGGLLLGLGVGYVGPLIA